MSSLHNQPVVEDIVSAFKTTQNQSWSMFNDKLGNIPIKDCKKKDIFKSENPIELSDEDIPVFGKVPRLEKLTLVSCNKCSMIVKRDCIHYHYNRRHNNPENDNFSLERFILPNAKTNKHKKQKINVRKLPEKKIIVGQNSDTVVQEIKTEFDQLEFEGIPEIEIKQEIKVEYVDECDDNLAIESCTPSMDDVFDWSLKPCTQSIIHYADHNVNDRMTDCDKNLNKLSAVLPDDAEELQSNKHLVDIKEENTIDFVINSSEKLSELPDSNKTGKSSIILDFSGIMSDDEDYYECNNKLKKLVKLQKLPSVLQNNEAQSSKYSDVINYGCSENITSLDQSFKSDDIKEQTKFSLSNNYSNVSNEDTQYKMNDNSQIVYHQLTSESLNYKEPTTITPNYKYLDVMSDKDSSNAITSYYQPTASLNTKEEIKIMPNTKYSVVLSDEEEHLKNNDNSKIEYCDILPKLLNNKERITFMPNFEYLDAPSDKCISDSIASFYQSSVGLIHNDESNILPNIKYSDVMSEEKENYEINDNSKITFYQLPSELSKNKTQSQFSPSNTCLEVLSKVNSDNSVTSIDNSSKLSLNIISEMKLIGNEYNDMAVINNDCSNHHVSSYDKSSIPLLDIKEKSKPSLIVKYPNNVVNDDYCYDTSKYEYYQLSSGYNNETLIPLSPDYNNYLDIISDEENDEIKDNNYQLPPELQSNDEETKDSSSNDYLDVANNESSDNASTCYDQSQTVSSSKNEGKLEPELLIDYLNVDNNSIVNSFENEYYQLSSELINNETQTSCTSSYKYPNVKSNDNSIISYDQSSNSSSDLEDTNLASKETYSDYTSDSNDSVTSNNQSTTSSLDITKETKYTQTCAFLNHINHKEYIDPITKIDESIAESIGVMDDKTKCTQTDLSLECIDCYKISEDFIDNYIPIDSDSDVEIRNNFVNDYTSNSSSTQINEYSMNSFNNVNLSSAQISGYPVNSFTPISSSAQIINNTIIPISAEVNDDNNHSVSNSSHYLSCFQQLPWSPESKNEHLSNRSTHSPAIDNYRLVDGNDKIYGSDLYTDKSKQNENIFYRNIINGSTPYMDKNHITCRDRLKKTIDENFVYRKNCKSHTNTNIETKIKKNLKRRMGGQVADGKENHNRWITGGFKKVKRVEFVVRKISYSDESDNNDNVDE